MPSHHHLHRLRRLIPAYVWTAAAFGQVGLGLMPMRVEVPITAGLRASGSFRVANESDGRIRVRMEPLDIRIDEDASPQFSPHFPKESTLTCRPWLQLNPREIELERHAKAMVRFTLNVPQELAPGSSHCAVGFSTMDPAGAPSEVGLHTNVRVIGTIHAVHGRAASSGTIKEILLERPDPKEPSKMRPVVVVENSGGVYFRAVGTADIVGQDGSITWTAPLPAVPILPLREQRLPLPFVERSQLTGKTIRVRVQLGSEEWKVASLVMAPSD